MHNRPWTQTEVDDAHRLSPEAFLARYPDRSEHGLRFKRARTSPPAAEREFVADKKVGEFNWREANKAILLMQQMKERASGSQDTATIRIAADKPVCIVGLCDAHIGSWGSDHRLFEAITDEILSMPNLYIALLGDLQQMAIKLRGVLEVSDNLLSPALQDAYFESWLAEVQHKIVCATWDNHSVERAEVGAGISTYAELLKKKVVYHNGIGHPDVWVNDQRYRFAVSHVFKGRSITNPCLGSYKYLVGEGHEREIAMAGDSHVPGILHFTHGPTPKLAVNGGSTQLNSGYGKRYFSLTTHPVFPAVVLWPDEHHFEAVWSLKQWLRMAA